jgi:hypothetical protein
MHLLNGRRSFVGDLTFNGTCVLPAHVLPEQGYSTTTLTAQQIPYRMSLSYQVDNHQRVFPLEVSLSMSAGERGDWLPEGGWRRTGGRSEPCLLAGRGRISV